MSGEASGGHPLDENSMVQPPALEVEEGEEGLALGGGRAPGGGGGGSSEAARQLHMAAQTQGMSSQAVLTSMRMGGGAPHPSNMAVGLYNQAMNHPGADFGAVQAGTRGVALRPPSGATGFMTLGTQALGNGGGGSLFGSMGGGGLSTPQRMGGGLFSSPSPVTPSMPPGGGVDMSAHAGGPGLFGSPYGSTMMGSQPAFMFPAMAMSGGGLSPFGVDGPGPLHNTGRANGVVQRQHSPLANGLAELTRGAPLDVYGCLMKPLASLAGTVVHAHLGSFEAFAKWVFFTLASLMNTAMFTASVSEAPMVLQEVMALILLCHELGTLVEHETWPTLANYVLATAKDFISTPVYTLSLVSEWKDHRLRQVRLTSLARNPTLNGGSGGGGGGGSGGGGGGPSHGKKTAIAPTSGMWCNRCKLFGWSEKYCPPCNSLAFPPGHVARYKKFLTDPTEPAAKKGLKDKAGSGNGTSPPEGE